MKKFVPILLFCIFLSLLLIGSRHHSGDAERVQNARFSKRNKELYALTTRAGYREAIPLYRAAANDARASGNLTRSIIFLNNMGACQIATFQFQAALRTLEEARSLAELIHEPASLAGLNANISALFQQMGNFGEAAKAAEAGVVHADAMRPAQRARLLAQLGTMRAQIGQLDRAEPVFAQAINTALQAENPDIDTAALAWDALGFARRKAGKLDAAEAAATEGFRLRKLLRASAIESSYMNLGAIRAARGDLRSALPLMDEAEKALHQPRSATPAWRIYMERGRIKLLAGELRPALDDLRRAHSLARAWRVDVVANDVNRTSSEETLAELYGLLIEAGNRLYLLRDNSVKHNSALISETFEAAEENRAASLRALIPQPNDWRRRLPPTYWETLARLQSAEAAWIGEGSPEAPAGVLLLRSKLAEMEAGAGAPAPDKDALALDSVRGALDKDSAFFSFQVGDSGSWVWAVTSDSISLHAAPPRAELAAQIHRLEQAAEGNSAGLAREGLELYRELFGSIEPEALARRRWLLALDGDLFGLPMPALRTSPDELLIEKHSLQIAPGALMLRPNERHGDRRGSFLAVGDPVYNRADERSKSAAEPAWPAFLTRAGYGDSPSFARLWGTAQEVQVAARTWHASKNELLTGVSASRANFWAATQDKPDIIHIATHILDENDRLQTGWIALSLGREGRPEYLTPEDISARSISARLVVLSGCSSGKAGVRTASGLMGLTRAWIAAGAGAVLATRWPTVDDDGAFFESFYRHLRLDQAAGPAEALRLASLEMLKSGTWRAQPSFWAGYFLVGNY